MSKPEIGSKMFKAFDTARETRLGIRLSVVVETYVVAEHTTQGFYLKDWRPEEGQLHRAQVGLRNRRFSDRKWFPWPTRVVSPTPRAAVQRLAEKRAYHKSMAAHRLRVVEARELWLTKLANEASLELRMESWTQVGGDWPPFLHVEGPGRAHVSAHTVHKTMTSLREILRPGVLESLPSAAKRQVEALETLRGSLEHVNNEGVTAWGDCAGVPGCPLCVVERALEAPNPQHTPYLPGLIFPRQP